jgi:hypothetical protein
VPVSDEDIRLFHASLDRASACPEGDFLGVFYDGFMASSSGVASLFERTDMERLKRKLKSSLHMMTMLADDAPGVEFYVEYLGRVHNRYQITEDMYHAWLDALIVSVRQCDPEFTPGLEQVWRRVLGRGIAIMVAGIGGRASGEPHASA